MCNTYTEQFHGQCREQDVSHPYPKVYHLLLKSNNNLTCVNLCEMHARAQGFVLADGSIHSDWEHKPSTTPIAAYNQRLINTAEPTCNPTLCRMHVGASVSIDHEKGCAWVKWNEARRVVKRVVKPADAPTSAAPSGAGAVPLNHQHEYTYFHGPHIYSTHSSGKACKGCLVYKCKTCVANGNTNCGARSGIFVCGARLATNEVTSWVDPP